jgi:hypothetical protein
MTQVAEVLLQAIPEYEYIGPDIALLLVLVDVADAVPGPGDRIIKRAQIHFPHLPAMLVAVTDNGFKAYAHFQTHKFLALVQMTPIAWRNVDLDAQPIDESELPF